MENRENRIKIFCNDSYKNKILGGKDPLLTFFTPTYNRANFLARIEDCLHKQTCRDFVWIIVNDGSKDNTETVAMSILRKEHLPIKFISKPNGGKHSAFKAALEQCETAYFQCMDDDDIYFPDAVEFFLRKWADIKSSGDETIGAIRTLSRRPNGTYSADFEIVEGDEYKASTIEVNYVMKRHMENWTCYDAKKLGSVNLFEPYWMSDQHKFVMESIWQTRFARKYKCLYVNKTFREYRDDSEISLMHGVKGRQHYIDTFLNMKVALDEQYDLIIKYRGEWALLKSVLIVNMLRQYLGIGYEKMISSVNNKRLRHLYGFTRIPSFLGKAVLTIVLKLRAI